MNKLILLCSAFLLGNSVINAQDVTPPVITCGPAINVNNTPGVCGAVVTYPTPTATDDVSGPPVSQTFNYTGSTQTYTVPAGVTMLTIEASGAQGGNNPANAVLGGQGAYVKGDYAVTAGQVFTIVVGGQGLTKPNDGGANYGGGGGGGSFVWLNAATPVVIAGGGGGGHEDGVGLPGLTTNAGGDATIGGSGGTAGTGGARGGVCAGAGGGGWVTPGADAGCSSYSPLTGGGSFSTFLAGTCGAPCLAGGSNYGTHGGYGGGGSAWHAGGGGGGYSGGGGGANSSSPGGGGGSFNAGTNQVATSGTRVGNGIVTITYPGILVTQIDATGLSSGSTFPIGITTLEYTATDQAGNTSTPCSFTVTVNDTEDPTITCSGNIVEIVGVSCQFTLPDYTGTVTAADNCAGTIVTQSPVAGTVISATTTIIMTATDASANTAQCTFDVSLNDATAPTAVCQNISMFLDGSGNATIVAADIDGGSTDNCGAVTLSASTTAFTCADLGANNVTLTATDANSNTATCVAVVTVLDTVSPVITCPVNQTENLDASCQFTLPDYTGLGTATDNCTATPTITQSPVAGTVITATTTITLTATDGSGNVASCSFDAVTVDAIAPTAVCQNINAYLDGSGNATIVAADIDGGSTDNCGAVTLSASTTAFTCADLGANNVTLTATDGNSITATCVAVVTVLDTVSPVIACPGNQTSTATAACQFSLLDYTGLATVTDNCSATPTTTQSPAVGSLVGLGATTITLTSDDGNGNTSQCTFDVTVSSSAVGTLDSTICYGMSFTFNSTVYNGANTTGVETLSGAAANGCDSLVTVTVTELTAIDTSVSDTSHTLTSNQAGASYQWLDCSNGNAVLVNDTNKAFTATANGDYAVVVTVGNCVDTSACVNIATVGIKEASSNVVSVYPNPTSGIITINLGDNSKSTNYIITSVDGRTVRSGQTLENEIKVDLSTESKGLYFLKVNNMRTYKIIKQ